MFEKDDLLSIQGVEEVENSFNGSEGGFKLVYKCIVNGKLNAVKITKVAGGTRGVNTEVIARLRRELGLLGSLNSPFLPTLGQLPVQRFDKNGDTYIIYSEEFIEGSDVCELVESHFFRDVGQTKKLLHDVLSAIELYWNHNKTVHRDVKPANIRHSTTTGNFILIDAGIAFVKDATTITPTGIGSPRTPLYASPEIIKGLRNYTFRTDLFSLGVVAYETVTGKHPFYVNGMRETELYDAILNQALQPIATLRQDVPLEVTDLIEKMLSKRPHQRPSKISDIIPIL